MRGNEEKRLQRVVASICVTLFAAFAFFFVAVYQAPLIEVFYNHVATGKLNFNSYIVGGIISAVLTIFALWLNRFAKFQREWTAMAYLPSTLLLSFVTDIDRTLYVGERSYTGWIVIFIVGMLLYAIFSFVLQRVLFEKIKNMAMSANRIIWRNLILFVILFCLAGTLSNGEENLKREALVAVRYSKGNVYGALAVGRKSLDASPQLTAMRAYILAADDKLGERMFEFPQYYGSRGLLPSPVQDSPLLVDSVYSLIGAAPSAGENAMQYLKRVADIDSLGSVAKDYYLSGLLLDRRLVEFKDELARLCGGYNPDSLPKHYREALLLCSEFTDDYSLELESDTLQQMFGRLREVERKYDDALVRNNYVRKEFGKTYWWYFLYGR